MQEFNKAVFAKRLRYLRTEILGLTVDEFCQRAGIAVQTYCNYLGQKHTARRTIVHEICQTFGVPEDWLLGQREEL